MNRPTLRESWTKGGPQYNYDLIEPVFFAQQALDGWTKAQAMKTFRALQIVFKKWSIEYGQPPDRTLHTHRDNSEPWRQAGSLVNDPADLLFRRLIPDSYPPLEELLRDTGRQQVLAAFILGEAIQADIRVLAGSSNNVHSQAALKAATWLARGQALEQANNDLQQLRETYEPILESAKRGQRVLRGAKSGHNAVHGTNEVKLARWAAYKATFDDLHAKHPLWSYEELKRRTAKRHNCSPKTIGNHCPNPSKTAHKS
ncbi:MAG TPA: hypothetical protein VJ437_06225 [Acidiferrobacterales bacterium]|nr:hypothetical protein [Acidiferrobacterales bacterium]